MRVLALDHGNARCGAAISDPTETLARPLDVIEPSDPARVAEVARSEEAEEVVVGLPVQLSGEEGAQAEAAREFAAALEEVLDIPVRTYDERLTTRMAAASRRAGSRAAEDSLAAAHLLESYMESRARRGNRGSPEEGPDG
jgi:putative transcription antitermination factor YqgF